VKKKIATINTLTAKKEVLIIILELQGCVSTNKNVLIYPEMAGTLQKD